MPILLGIDRAIGKPTSVHGDHERQEQMITMFLGHPDGLFAYDWEGVLC
jgi:hypothetical protein